MLKPWFIVEALEQLRWINLHLEHAEGTDKQALEGARRELVELIQSAVSGSEKGHCADDACAGVRAAKQVEEEILGEYPLMQVIAIAGQG